MDDAKPFIDGSWYDEQYAQPGSRYHNIYVAQDTPAWAKQADRFHAAQALAWLPRPELPAAFHKHGAAGGAGHVLDLGSGVGRFVETWRSFNLLAVGVEISKAAVAEARRRGRSVHCASAADLSLFADQTFAFAFSASFMEHIDRSITPAVVKESLRVARAAAHYIPLVAGDDPSHIHIQSVAEWVVELRGILHGTDYVVNVVQNAVDSTQPLFLIQHERDVTWAVGQPRAAS